MKFRIIASILVVLFLVLVYVFVEQNNSSPTPQSDGGLTISH